MIIYLYGFIIALVGFISGVIYIKKKYRKIHSRGTGRFGIIRYLSGYNNTFFIEIEEIETAGEYTKVRLIDVYSTYNSDSKKYDLLKNSTFNEWTLTNSITWFDNNSQKVRDKKLKEILGNG